MVYYGALFNSLALVDQYEIVGRVLDVQHALFFVDEFQLRFAAIVQVDGQAAGSFKLEVNSACHFV